MSNTELPTPGFTHPLRTHPLRKTLSNPLKRALEGHQKHLLLSNCYCVCLTYKVKRFYLFYLISFFSFLFFLIQFGRFWKPGSFLDLFCITLQNMFYLSNPPLRQCRHLACTDNISCTWVTLLSLETAGWKRTFLIAAVLRLPQDWYKKQQNFVDPLRNEEHCTFTQRSRRAVRAGSFISTSLSLKVSPLCYQPLTSLVWKTAWVAANPDLPFTRRAAMLLPLPAVSWQLPTLASLTMSMLFLPFT